MTLARLFDLGVWYTRNEWTRVRAVMSGNRRRTSTVPVPDDGGKSRARAMDTVGQGRGEAADTTDANLGGHVDG